MRSTIDRRLLLKVGTIALGGLALPGSAVILAARGFTHNVASGEPRARSVMLWTRYLPRSGDSARLHFQVSPDQDFTRIQVEGTTSAEAECDYTAKAVAEGLEPDRWYFYRFRDGAGHASPVGRTRTLPEGPAARFTLALFSCANIHRGWFNAYAHAARRRDIDLVVHVGDYLYAGRTGRARQLAEFRRTFAHYRADPDLQQLHRMFPMVAMWDDHENANNSWSDGALDHRPDREGPWTARKAASIQAYREWMPVSDAAWESYEIGDLATLFRPETRLTARTRQLDLVAALRGRSDREAALAAFRDGPWQDPARTLLGPEQEAWLADGLRRSVARGAAWQVVAQQVVMGSLALPLEAAEWIASSPFAPARVRAMLAASRAGLPFELDGWNGYPAARRRLLRAALDAEADMIVLSGDSHNGWAFDLDLDGTTAGVELAGQSVTSRGLERSLPGVSAETVVRAAIARNPQLKWADFRHRGYVTLDLTPERATGQWVFLDTVHARSTRLAGRHSLTVPRGAKQFA